MNMKWIWLVPITVILVIVAVILLQPDSRRLTLGRLVSPTELPEAPPPARLVWSTFNSNQQAGQAAAGQQVTQVIAVGPSSHLHVEVQTDAGGQVTLRDPQGQIIAPIIKSQTQTIYDQTGQVPGGNWQVIIGNPATNAPVNYEVKVPNATPPLVIVPTINQAITGQTITISIAVKETVGQTTQPVTGAQVTANITNPQGQVITIILQEVPGQPGLYTGDIGGDQPAGTYDIEYVIDGQKADGQPFVQSTKGQFTISPDPTLTTQNYFSTYDINRGNEVQLIGY